MNKHQVHQLIDVVMEGAKRPDPIKIRKQVTVVMVLTFGWREMGATNKERLLIDKQLASCNKAFTN